jgi:hypothetical protein
VVAIDLDPAEEAKWQLDGPDRVLDVLLAKKGSIM